MIENRDVLKLLKVENFIVHVSTAKRRNVWPSALTSTIKTEVWQNADVKILKQVTVDHFLSCGAVRKSMKRIRMAGRETFLKLPFSLCYQIRTNERGYL